MYPLFALSASHDVAIYLTAYHDMPVITSLIPTVDIYVCVFQSVAVCCSVFQGMHSSALLVYHMSLKPTVLIALSPK